MQTSFRSPSPPSSFGIHVECYGTNIWKLFSLTWTPFQKSQVGVLKLYHSESTINTRDVLEIHRYFFRICCRFLDSFQWFAGDPTFMEMKTAFWESPDLDPLGADILCPRDGKPGCALVDWIDRDERREQSHFMSWTWQYRLMQVRSALEMYQANSSAVPADVFLDSSLEDFWSVLSRLCLIVFTLHSLEIKLIVLFVFS